MNRQIDVRVKPRKASPLRISFPTKRTLICPSRWLPPHPDELLIIPRVATYSRPTERWLEWQPVPKYVRHQHHPAIGERSTLKRPKVAPRNIQPNSVKTGT